MATYDEIYGKRVEVLDADPTLSSAYEGQVWYNSSTGALKSVVSFGAYSSGGNMNAGVSTMGGGGASSSQAISAKGNPASPPSDSNAAESYNGTGWASLPTTNVAMRNCAGASQSSTSAVVFGGTPPIGGQTELWDGSSWTAKTAMNNARENLFGAGSGTAALGFGGAPAPNAAKTEEWSGPGNSWTNKTDMSTGRTDAGAGGSVTSALVYGGSTPPGPRTAATEEYNGSSWTTQSNLNTTRAQLTGTGPNADNQIAQGGNTGSATGATERWDGTSWTTSAPLSTARIDLNSGGTNTDAVAFGGAAPPSSRLTTTEEYSFGINTITAAAWASGTNMPESNYGAGSFGTQTAFVYFGGQPYPPRTNATREYNGTAWATTGNYTGSLNYLAGTGVETAGLGAGGFTGTATPTASAEYDGSSWTAGNSMNQARMNTGSTMAGTQTAAAIAGGDKFPSTPRSLTAVEEYDGTNWTAVTALPTATQNMAVTGPQTASVFAGGISDTNPGTPNAYPTNVYEYDGTNWTSGTALPIATYRAGAAGTQTDAIIFSGGTSPGGPGGPGESVTTLGYDGTSWSTRPNMGTARQSVGAGGTASPSTAAIGAGGYIIPGTTASTEEFTGTTTAVTAKTLTTS